MKAPRRQCCEGARCVFSLWQWCRVSGGQNNLNDLPGKIAEMRRAIQGIGASLQINENVNVQAPEGRNQRQHLDQNGQQRAEHRGEGSGIRQERGDP